MKKTDINKILGIEEGFENVVTEKQTFEGNSSDKILKQEYWSYRTTTSADGNSHVEYQHIEIDMTKPAVEALTRSGWQKAEPSKYKPDEE